jgi:hypothetical protein
MLYDPNIQPAQVYYCCRNPRCGDALKAPTANPRSAFCCPSCEQSFYRVRCRVCERPLPGRKTARRQLCGRSVCRHEFQRHGEHFVSAWYAPPVGPKRPKKPSRYLGSRGGQNAEKSSTISKAKSAVFGDRPWRAIAGPRPPEINLRIPLDPRTAAGLERQRKILADHVCELGKQALIQRDTPPVNIAGGYKFPDAPKIDLGSPIPKSPTPHVAGDLIIPDDLCIPAFLRRTHKATK